MPELPDIELYRHALAERIVDRPIERIAVLNPFVLRTFDPPIEEAESKRAREVRRIGKRIVLALDDELFLVSHLMIAGRFRWLKPGSKPIGKITLAMLHFHGGILAMTEAGTKKRASIHLVRGETNLRQHDPGGLEVLDASYEAFAAALRRENHTLKRSLTDPRLFSGIGNAYSDEILHEARLSPVLLTSRMNDDEIRRLYDATRETLQRWTNILREEFAGRFPGQGDVTAFRDDFATHGRFGKPCPVCNTSIQRIRYAENETNYCPTCQTGGKNPRRPLPLAPAQRRLAPQRGRAGRHVIASSQRSDERTQSPVAIPIATPLSTVFVWFFFCGPDLARQRTPMAHDRLRIARQERDAMCHCSLNSVFSTACKKSRASSFPSLKKNTITTRRA